MLPSILETCIPREEILAGELSVDLFAAKLHLVVEGKASAVYQKELFKLIFSFRALIAAFRCNSEEIPKLNRPENG